MVKRERGFSLMEVVTALGVSGILLLVVTTLSFYSYFQFQNMKTRLEAEIEANRLEYLFKTYLTQAVNISGAVGAGLTEATGANFTINDVNATGQWFGPPNGAAVIWDQMGDLAGDWVTLGVFVREVGTAAAGGELVPTAIWFRKPSAITSGVVFFDDGSNPGNMAPSYSDQFVSGITRLEFQRRDVADALASLRISFTLRYHVKSGASVNGWCPVADINAAVVGCVNANNNFREIEKNFDVVVRNNYRSDTSVDGSAVEQRTLGRLYFFKVINPARWNL